MSTASPSIEIGGVTEAPDLYGNSFPDICVTELSAPEALRQSQQDLEDFFENAVVALHWLASDGTILRANQAELDLLGYTHGEYVGRHIANFHADRAIIDDILARLAGGEKLDKYPARLRAKDGSIKLVQISSNVRFETGAFVHTRCFTVDVTAQQQAEAILRERERQSRALLDALPAAVYTTDAEGRITYYNEAAVELSGRRPELGRDQWCVTWRLYRPDGTPLPHDECPMAVALKENRPIRGAEAVAERPDGSRVPFIPFPTPLRDDSGAMVGAVNMLVDITERKAAEKALRESEERLSNELDATRQLQDISAQLLHERGIEGLYGKIIDAAASIMRSDYASMQMFYPERGSAGKLRLLAFRGFNPQAAKFWEWVRPDSGCTCGMAMRTGQRAIAANVETCDFMADTEDLAAYLQAGICAAQSTPLVSRSGYLLGMISTHWRRPHNPSESDLRRLDVLARQAADLIERAHAETAVRESEERFRALVDASAQIVWTANADAAVVEDSPTWRAFTGQTYEQWKDFGWLDAIHPDDHGRIASEWRDAVGRNAPIEVDYRIRHVSGEWRWTTARAAPVFAADGSLKMYVGMNTDITERKRVELRQQLLMDELNHRVKNTLATVQSIAAQLLKGTPDIELRETFDGRLVALSRTHDLLVRDSWEAAPLRDLLLQEFEPYRSEEGARFVIDGPDLRLNPKAALTLGMAFHELATNAAKYGALSKPAGQVRVTWEVLRASEPRALRLKWMETGGPPVQKREHRGFGSSLIERGVSLELEGEVRVDFDPGGLICTMEIPLAAVGGRNE